MKKRLYVTELRAGAFIKKVSMDWKPKGGKSIEYLYDADGKTSGEYAVLSTGEVKEFADNSAGGRLANPRQISLLCEKFKWRVRANAHRATLFITLTYSENMTDTKRLYEDFRRFWQKYKRKYGAEDYLLACEPQERGAWHCHVIMLGGSRYIPNEDVASMWGHGFTQTQNCKKIADLGNYLTAYLTKLDGKKNQRLKMYPQGFRFLRWSRGALEAEIKKYVEEIEEDEDDQMKGYTKTSDKTIEKAIEGRDEPLHIRITEFCRNDVYAHWQDEKRKKRAWKRHGTGVAF